MRKQAIVIPMRADPVPHDFIPFQDSHRPIVLADPDRIDWLCRMDRLETKIGMVRILAKDPISPARLTLNFTR